MGLPRMRSPRGSTRRRVALWSALAMGGILPSVGCQVEYAGMTLPSGRYMHDDVQYFPSGPDFPWANTQAATQRARMRAMGIEPPPPPAPFVQPGGPAINPLQQQGGRPQDINAGPFGAEPNIGAPAAQPPPPPDPALAQAGRPPRQPLPAHRPEAAAVPPPPPPGDNP